MASVRVRSARACAERKRECVKVILKWVPEYKVYSIGSK